jgi:hypothetical protein
LDHQVFVAGALELFGNQGFDEIVTQEKLNSSGEEKKGGCQDQEFVRFGDVEGQRTVGLVVIEATFRSFDLPDDNIGLSVEQRANTDEKQAQDPKSNTERSGIISLKAEHVN